MCTILDASAFLAYIGPHTRTVGRSRHGSSPCQSPSLASSLPSTLAPCMSVCIPPHPVARSSVFSPHSHQLSCIEVVITLRARSCRSPHRAALEHAVGPSELVNRLNSDARLALTLFFVTALSSKRMLRICTSSTLSRFSYTTIAAAARSACHSEPHVLSPRP